MTARSLSRSVPTTGGRILIVFNLHFEFGRVLNDVKVGQDVAAIVYDRTGARCSSEGKTSVAFLVNRVSDVDDTRTDGLIDLDVVLLIRSDGWVGDGNRLDRRGAMLENALSAGDDYAREQCREQRYGN